jgi:hypothetical protein
MDDTRTDAEVTRDVFRGLTVGFAKSGMMLPQASRVLAGDDLSDQTPETVGVRDGLAELGYLQGRPAGTPRAKIARVARS